MTTPHGSLRKRRIIHGLDLAGWEAIANALDIEPRTAQRWAQREDDPLPVKKFLGRARANSDEIRAWCARNTEAMR